MLFKESAPAKRRAYAKLILCNANEYFIRIKPNSLDELCSQRYQTLEYHCKKWGL